MQFSIVSPVHRSLIFLGSVLLWTAVATEPFWAQAQQYESLSEKSRAVCPEWLRKLT